MIYALVHVHQFPDQIEPFKLYWSKEFGISAHRCACGCGDIIYLPIGPMDYSLDEGRLGPTLRPSIGNWNVCDAHYFITNGSVEWAPKWTPERVAVARSEEDARRLAYYDDRRMTFVKRLGLFAKRLLKVIKG